ncbi:MAG: hypothetical protein ACLQDI_10950 [Syntrophobacteraceae bacterium]
MTEDPIYLSQSELEDWLNRLAGSHEGTIKLINMFLSKKHGLVEEGLLRRFLVDCVSVGSKTNDDASSDFDGVCRSDERYFALCRTDPLSLSSSSLITIMDVTVFQEFILNPRQPRKNRVAFVHQYEPHGDIDSVTFHKLYGKEPPKTVEESVLYRRMLKDVTSRKNWYNLSGFLGKPYPDPNHVWFFELSGIKNGIKATPGTDGYATEVRDALGLIDVKANTYLLAIQFFCEDLHRITNLKMARPGFADLGNRRFAVCLNDISGDVYKNNWGLTVHLGKLRANPPQKAIDGIPERICSPIPLSNIADSIDVAPLGWVISNRGEETGVDDDPSFIGRLLGCAILTRIEQDISHIKRDILKIANRP